MRAREHAPSRRVAAAAPGPPGRRHRRRLARVRAGDARRSRREPPGDRHPGRPRHARLARDRGSSRARTTGTATARCSTRSAARASRPWSRSGGHPRGRTAAVGPNVPPPVGSHVRVVRAGRRRALPVGAPLDRLERAEPAPLAAPAVADDLCHEAPQSRGGAAIKEVIPQAIDRRGCDRSPRRLAAGMSPGRLHPRDGPGGRAARCVRPSPASTLACGDAVHGRLLLVRDHQHGDPRPPRRRDPRHIRATHADLADRARVPDEPAGPHPRRDVGEAGAVRRRGAVARVRNARCRPAGPVPRARRAEARRLAERARDRVGHGQARHGLVIAAPRPGLPHRHGDHRVGAGPTGRGNAAVSPPASRRRPLGRGSAARPDECPGVLHADDSRRPRRHNSASTTRQRAGRARRSSSPEPPARPADP